MEGLGKALEQRKFDNEKREVLYNELLRQYDGFHLSNIVSENIEKLKKNEKKILYFYILFAFRIEHSIRKFLV